MDYQIDLDGYIGDYYNGRKWVKNKLAENKNKPVFVRTNSLGGSVNDALDIAAQFEAHGNVTVEMFSFNASATTVLTLGANKVRAHADSLYLIHKVMSWVNAWGMMNEDNIQDLIDELEKEKKENEKITLVLARKYALKTGKSITDILNLMKQETWLTANEAKEWGFVDEVFGKATGKVNFTPEMKEKFNIAELPIPHLKNNQEDSKGLLEKIEEKFDGFKNDILSRMGINNDKETNNENPVINMKKEWTHINTLLEVEGIETKDGKINLTEDQLQKLNDAIQSANEAKTTAENSLTEKTKEYDQLKTDYDNLKGSAGADSNPVNKNSDVGKGGKVEDDDLKAAIEAQKMFNILNK
ncbi:hypothetical protein D0T84_16315 [Dysgonomonas sp. 521]|uniref:Clp protease ClpP n=1 Tax=Dysgonomonas sp. 521 TaxID=2302932 RepID=UPI0013D1B810|nr:Clp protease ClpP [Dysgonomonas sp. 521]NDV96466.1 hypothetical protein [Dysgonomonas sp. 521]